VGDAGEGGASAESAAGGEGGENPADIAVAGVVAVGITPDSTQNLYSSASVLFALPIERPNCTTQTFGDCRVTLCDPTTDLPTKADAGEITVNFADKLSLQMLPTPEGYYADQTGPPVASPGDSISIHATGDEIPAFSASITQPEALRVTAPVAAPDAYGWLTARSDTDLELTFTGGAAGVWLGADSHGSYTTGGSFSVQCSFASQAGTALIPKGALYYSSSLYLYAFRRKTLLAGDYPIDLESRNVVFDSAGVDQVHIDVEWIDPAPPASARKKPAAQSGG